jgi:hypothetical protein
LEMRALRTPSARSCSPTCFSRFCGPCIV